MQLEPISPPALVSAVDGMNGASAPARKAAAQPFKATQASEAAPAPQNQAPQATQAPQAGPEEDATLRLLRSCVEAMGLLQAKCEGLDTELNLKIDVAQREVTALRTALTGAEAAATAATTRLDEVEARATKAEAAAQEQFKRLSEELTLARTEAANWRMRAETDGMAFDHLSGRIGTLEAGLAAKLSDVERQKAEQEAAASQVKAKAEHDANRATRLEAQLRGVEATIADQRSRISCLQSKLATATYAIRMEQLTQTKGDVDDREIMDLQGMSPAKSMISAA